MNTDISSNRREIHFLYPDRVVAHTISFTSTKSVPTLLQAAVDTKELDLSAYEMAHGGTTFINENLGALCDIFSQHQIIAIDLVPRTSRLILGDTASHGHPNDTRSAAVKRSISNPVSSISNPQRSNSRQQHYEKQLHYRTTHPSTSRSKQTDADSTKTSAASSNSIPDSRTSTLKDSNKQAPRVSKVTSNGFVAAYFSKGAYYQYSAQLKNQNFKLPEKLRALANKPNSDVVVTSTEGEVIPKLNPPLSGVSHYTLYIKRGKEYRQLIAGAKASLALVFNTYINRSENEKLNLWDVVFYFKGQRLNKSELVLDLIKKMDDESKIPVIQVREKGKSKSRVSTWPSGASRIPLPLKVEPVPDQSGRVGASSHADISLTHNDMVNNSKEKLPIRKRAVLPASLANAHRTRLPRGVPNPTHDLTYKQNESHVSFDTPEGSNQIPPSTPKEHNLDRDGKQGKQGHISPNAGNVRTMRGKRLFVDADESSKEDIRLSRTATRLRKRRMTDSDSDSDSDSNSNSDSDSDDVNDDEAHIATSSVPRENNSLKPPLAKRARAKVAHRSFNPNTSLPNIRNPNALVSPVNTRGSHVTRSATKVAEAASLSEPNTPYSQGNGDRRPINSSHT